ncbi:hypothetical protein [Ahniella affigens]|nr:hypothetical protein [Ahniella affigens]
MVEHASFHQVVLADQDQVILNNRYPPGGDSGFHAHERDQFFVVIQPSETTAQALGQPLKAGPTLAVGAVGYGGEFGTRRVHRVINGKKSEAQFIVVEFRRAAPNGIAVSTREAAPQYVQVVDNARLRAWRLILEPGASVPTITQVGKGVRVVVRGGLLSTREPGKAPQLLWLKPADVAVQEAGATRALTNTGNSTVELIELELK